MHPLVAYHAYFDVWRFISFEERSCAKCTAFYAPSATHRNSYDTLSHYVKEPVHGSFKITLIRTMYIFIVHFRPELIHNLF